VTENHERSDQEIENRPDEPHGLRLPGFVNDEDVGLGEAIKQVTSAIGIRPCGSCERRAAALNRLLVFSGRRPK
jgi:hypothetical protein